METKQLPERRHQDRRTLLDRRTGEFEATYQRLVREGVVQENRQIQRRKTERRDDRPEERYAEYVSGLKKINAQRQKSALPSIPMLSYEHWRELYRT